MNNTFQDSCMGAVKGIIGKLYCDAAYENLVLYQVNLLELGQFFHHSQAIKLRHFLLNVKTCEVEEESVKIIIETKINGKERAEKGTLFKLTDIEAEVEFLEIQLPLISI